MIPIGIQEQGGSEELDERVTAIENQEDMENVFVAMQNFSFQDNILTIYSGWIWKLLGVNYSNPANVSFPIDFCAAGKSRFEYIVPNNENGFTRITGQETLGTAQAPQLPAHGLYVTFFLVTDSAIGIPKQPNIAKTPNIQEILDEGYSTTNIIWFYNNNNSNCLGISSERILFQKLESVFNQISADNTTESYNVQLPNKTGGAEETIAMASDFKPATDEALGLVKTDVPSENPTVYVKETTDELLKGKANYFLAVKPITGISYNVIIEDILNELLYDGTLPMNVIIPNNATVPFPVGTIFYTLGTNTGILSASGAAGVVLKVKTGISLSAIQNEVRQYTKIAINTWSVRGDLNLGAVTQTELSYLQGATSNIQAQINSKVTLNGVPNFLMKFLTSSTATVSRLFDNGTFFGIGTANPPTKDFTLGNQANKEIGIEESNNTTKGRDLIIRGGRTIDYAPSYFVDLYYGDGIANGGQGWAGIFISPTTRDMYVINRYGNLFYRAYGSLTLTNSGLVSGSIKSVYISPQNNLYVTSYENIFMRINNVGNFVSLTGAPPYSYYEGMVVTSNGDFYIARNGGDIYKQVNQTGTLIGLGEVSRAWKGLAVDNFDNIYACVFNGDIYKKTGSGNFIALGVTYRGYTGICITKSNDIYVSTSTGDVYRQTGGIGAFTLFNAFGKRIESITCDIDNNIYITVDGVGGMIYVYQNNVLGTPNLDGGALKLQTGTGKGTGKQRLEFWTGQKTASGTDMQIETLREYIDENGYHIYTSMPVYADNAAALVGGLPIGCEYRTVTGIKMIVY